MSGASCSSVSERPRAGRKAPCRRRAAMQADVTMTADADTFQRHPGRPKLNTTAAFIDRQAQARRRHGHRDEARVGPRLMKVAACTPEINLSPAPFLRRCRRRARRRAGALGCAQHSDAGARGCASRSGPAGERGQGAAVIRGAPSIVKNMGRVAARNRELCALRATAWRAFDWRGQGLADRNRSTAPAKHGGPMSSVSTNIARTSE